MPRIMIIRLAGLVLTSSTVLCGGQSDKMTYVEKSTESEIVLEFGSGNVEIGESLGEGDLYDMLRVDGFNLSAEVGKPLLPARTTLLGIPSSGLATTEIIEAEIETRNVNRIYPNPKISFAQSGKEIKEFVIDDAIYETDEFYPSSPVQIADIGFMRTQRVARIVFYPIQYNPVRGEIKIYRRLKARININSAGIDQGTLNSMFRAKYVNHDAEADFDKTLRYSVLNYNSSKDWRIPTVPQKSIISKNLVGTKEPEIAASTVPIEDADYIIIVHQALNSGTWLDDLIVLKNAQGLSVGLLQISDGKTTNQIKADIEYAYFNGTTMPSYVLLVGDAVNVDSASREIADAASGNFVPTFYETVSGWRLNTELLARDDGYAAITPSIAEHYPSVDYFPDLFIGRIPAESVEQIQHFVDKLTYYQNDTQDAPWKNDFLFISENRDWGYASQDTIRGEDVDRMVQVIQQDYVPQLWDVATLNTGDYSTDGERYSAFESAVNNGQILINAFGTASWWTSVVHFYDDDADVTFTNNGMYPFLAGFSCGIGMFQEYDQQAGQEIDPAMETLLFEQNAGIIGSFSPTGGTGQAGNLAIARFFYETLFEEDVISLGPLSTIAKIKFENHNVMLWHAKKYTLFGDPAMRLAMNFSDYVEPDYAGNGFETQDQGWIHQNDVAFSLFVDAYEAKITVSENGVFPISGKKMYKVHGYDQDEHYNPHYAYWKISDLNRGITSESFLSFWIYVYQSPSTVGHISVDAMTTDGFRLKDWTSGGYIVDQNGDRIHPAYRTTPLGQWVNYIFDLSPMAGKTLDYLMVGYDDSDGPDFGSFTAYFDDIDISPKEISGSILENTTWSGVINVTGDIAVRRDVTLTILPGTRVYFSANSDDQNAGFYRDKSSIEVNPSGTLLAVGESGKQIVFRSSDASNPTNTDWEGINVGLDGNAVLQHAIVRDAIWGVYASRPSSVDVLNIEVTNCGTGISYYYSGGQVSESDIHNNGTGIYFYESTADILRNSVMGNTGLGAIEIDNSSPLTEGNVISNNTGRSGIELGNNSSPVIRKNVIAYNSTGDGQGIYCGSGNNAPIIENNTIVGNNGYGGIGVDNNASPVIRNNIVVQNTGQSGAGIHNSSGTPQISYNDVWGNSGEDYFDCSPGIGDISNDPFFVDAQNGNYHLVLDSPSIDAGDPTSDYNYEPAPNGERINMGAYGNTSDAAVTARFADTFSDGNAGDWRTWYATKPAGIFQVENGELSYYGANNNGSKYAERSFVEPIRIEYGGTTIIEFDFKKAQRVDMDLIVLRFQDQSNSQYFLFKYYGRYKDLFAKQYSSANGSEVIFQDLDYGIGLNTFYTIRFEIEDSGPERSVVRFFINGEEKGAIDLDRNITEIGEVYFRIQEAHYHLDNFAVIQPVWIPGASKFAGESNAKTSSTFSIKRTFPNPFNPHTKIVYTLSSDSRHSLTVYDILGRQVRILYSGWKPAGEYALNWNGRDQDGKELPTGVYLVRLKATSHVSTHKILLIR